MLNLIFILVTLLIIAGLISLSWSGKRYWLGSLRRMYAEIKWRMAHDRKTSGNARALLAANTASLPTRTLVLVYNSMFGMPLSLDEVHLPSGCAITTNRRYRREAAAVIYHIPTLPRRTRILRYPGQLQVAWFIESGAQYPLLNDPQFMRQFDLSISFRQNADIWSPCYFPDFDQLAGAAPQPKHHERLLAAFISYPADHSGRRDYLQALMRHLEVHSYGSLFRNRPLSRDVGRATKLQVLSGYKFNLAYENSIESDYVTEKFFDPLEAGCVPVYLGAPNIERYAPGDHCYINAADFAGPEALAAYLIALNEDEAAYNAYHAWRRQPPRAGYQRLYEAQRIHPLIRLCKLLQQRPLPDRSSVLSRSH